MMSMQTISAALAALGASDTAIATMGPTLTIIIALFGGYVAAQTLKWPLSVFVTDPWHSHLTRYTGQVAAFLLAHYLSNHLSVPVEVVVALAQPTIYDWVQRATANIPWLAWMFKTVDKGKAP